MPINGPLHSANWCFTDIYVSIGKYVKYTPSNEFIKNGKSPVGAEEGAIHWSLLAREPRGSLIFRAYKYAGYGQAGKASERNPDVRISPLTRARLGSSFGTARRPAVLYSLEPVALLRALSERVE